MKYNDIKKIDELYFTYQDVAKILLTTEDSARVLCSRYVKQKYFIRLTKKGILYWVLSMSVFLINKILFFYVFEETSALGISW